MEIRGWPLRPWEGWSIMANSGMLLTNIIHTRRNIQDYKDPYISQLDPGEIAICGVCNGVYTNHRWYLNEQVDVRKLKNQPLYLTTCPACRKTRDNFPGGIVRLSGNFLKSHKKDIFNLVHNENERAMGINPLERIIDIVSDGTDYIIQTTNEKLAQRIGRSIHKAYSGDVKFSWSEDNKLVRVTWQRE